MIDATFDFGERGRLVVVRDPAELAREAVDIALSTVIAAQAERHWSYAALSGGSTPKAMGEVLAKQPYRDLIAWHYLHVFWGDERSVPLKSPDSNAGEAKRIFLDHVPIPASQVHIYETDDPAIGIDQAALDYQTLLQNLLPSEHGTPQFDLIFLGMGDDGHTASLFPDTAPIHNNDDLVVSHFVPKLNTNRITFTPRLLNAAREIVFLVGGSGKAEKLREVLEGPLNVDSLPSQVIRPTHGNLTWLVDRAAAASLSIAGELPRG